MGVPSPLAQTHDLRRKPVRPTDDIKPYNISTTPEIHFGIILTTQLPCYASGSSSTRTPHEDLPYSRRLHNK